MTSFNELLESVRPAEVKNLLDLLQYQDSSIVSRVLLKNKGGTVTLFAFDAGEGLSEHTAPFDALVVVTDGDAQVEIAPKVSGCVKAKPLFCRRIDLTQ